MVAVVIGTPVVLVAHNDGFVVDVAAVHHERTGADQLLLKPIGLASASPGSNTQPSATLFNEAVE